MAEKRFRPLPQNMRGFKAARCPDCWMESRLCVCDLLPQIQVPVRLIIVMQWKESGRSSNTGRLARLAIPGTEIRLRGRPDQPLDLSDLVGREDVHVLYPMEGAQPLGRSLLPKSPREITLVVPDGTWRQARRMVRHDRDLTQMPAVVLPPGPPSVYRLRKLHGEGQVSTYEAIARALGLLFDPGLEAQLMKPFIAMVERTLWARGRLCTEQVSGGVPDPI